MKMSELNDWLLVVANVGVRVGMQSSDDDSTGPGP